MAGAADSASGRARGPKGGCVSDEKVIVREGGQLPPCPVSGGESGIRWSRSRPATLEEITRALDRIEGRNGRIAPPVDELERLVRDAFTALDIELTQESEDVARRAYPLFRDAASVEQRLAMIDESWSRGFDDDRWPASVFVTAMLENEPALVAAGAARYAAFVMTIEELAWDEIGRLFYGAEDESEMCRAATFLGMAAVGDSEILGELREIRSELTDDEVEVICGITLVNPNLATVVFLLEWMDEAQRHNDHTRFAQLASLVERSGAASECGAFSPATSLDAGDLRLRVCYDVQFSITREQFGRHIRERLETLAERETRTRLIPPVLEAWGLRCSGEVG